MTLTTQTPTLTTSRLLLKAFTPEVYQEAFTQFTPEQQMELFGCKTAKELEIEQDRFEKGMTTFNKTFLFFQLRDLHTNEMLGWCGFHTWYFPHHRAELFYMLNNETHRKHGLMTEALRTVLQYGFNEMQLERVEAFVGKENHASLALLQKFEFTYEGTFRNHYRINNINEDSLAYSLLKAEFTTTN